MKTSDLVQLGALALVGYLVYQKMAKGTSKGPSPAPTPAPNPPLQPYQLPPDMGVNNPNDPTWGDTQGINSITSLLEPFQ